MKEYRAITNLHNSALSHCSVKVQGESVPIDFNHVVKFGQTNCGFYPKNSNTRTGITEIVI